MKLKSIIILFCVLFIIPVSFSINKDDNYEKKSLTPTIEKQTELLSIVFRLAGNKEYNSEVFRLYTDKIKNQFDSYKKHDAVMAAQDLVRSNNIVYDAVMSLAVNLDEDLNLIDSNNLGNRWIGVDLNDFLTKLKKFRLDTKFDNFYMENMSLYAEAIYRFKHMSDNIDISWYDKFFGKDNNINFKIILSMSNGDHNYGPSSIDPKTGKKTVFSIISAWKTDDNGMAIYNNDDYLPIIIHEFNHSFINHLTEKHFDLFKENGSRIFAQVEDIMRGQAYLQTQIMLNEALVRAATIKYIKDHDGGNNQIFKLILMEKQRGFYWISNLYEELQKYDNKREEYPDLDSYMPQLAAAYSGFADYVENYDEIRPKVISVDEINGIDPVSKEIKTITINFDKPILNNRYSMDGGPKGNSAFPKVTKFEYINDKKSLRLNVELEADSEYCINLWPHVFFTKDGDIIPPFCLDFKTSK